MRHAWRILSVAVLILAACGGGAPRRPGPGAPPRAEPVKRDPALPAAPVETRYLDEDCLVQAESILLVLPRVLREELEAEALTGGWEGDVYRGRGRVDVTVRKLRLLAERLEIRLTGGPISNLRVAAEGAARISTTTMERVEEPARRIILKPDEVLIE